jgi:hypothetical protein
MPGVRVRVSRRGVRTSVGPRIARVHVGAGRTGFSSGLGPVTYSTSSGRTSSGRRGGGYSGYATAYGMTPTQAAKLGEAQRIQETLDRLTKAHQQKFPTAAKRLAVRPTVPDQKELDKRFKTAALKPLGTFAFGARRAAKKTALEQAASYKVALEAEADRLRNEAQDLLDSDWVKLLSNDPELVIDVVTDAFGDNEAKAVVVGVEGSTMTVVMLAPDIAVVPQRDWSRTAAGNLSVKNMLVRDRQAYYFDAVMSNAVATAVEGFACAPGIAHIQLVVVQEPGTRGGSGVECIGAGLFDRAKLTSTGVAGTPFSVAQAACGFWSNNIDAKLRMRPIDLGAEPEIAELLKHFEWED